jgi:hypothetical protein
MSVSTEASLRLASSSVFCSRCTCPDCSRTNCLRVRSSARIAWVGASGTKLARTSPWASRSASQAASATSVLRPGTFLTCAALARTSASSPSESTCQTGFQYTPVASITAWVQPHPASHAPSASSPGVVASNRRTSRCTPPGSASRTAAATLSLCTSRPAQRGWRTSIAASLLAAGAGRPGCKL